MNFGKDRKVKEKVIEDLQEKVSILSHKVKKIKNSIAKEEQYLGKLFNHQKSPGNAWHKYRHYSHS